MASVPFGLLTRVKRKNIFRRIMSSQNKDQLKAITLSDIQEAQKNIQGSVNRTEVQKAPEALYKLIGNQTQIFFKMENEQLAGSFKIRGALNMMGSLTDEQKRHGVVASSAGNHAQGVALGAKKFGAKAHIVMPISAPIVKVNATRGYGAEVILHGDFYDEAYAHAKELEKTKGYVFVHPFEDARIIAGQGTVLNCWKKLKNSVRSLCQLVAAD
jgi:threonine dehydratase